MAVMNHSGNETQSVTPWSFAAVRQSVSVWRFSGATA